MYFNHARVKWDVFSPNDIYFKSSLLTRGLEDEINVISYKNKGDFHQAYTHGVFVKFNRVKDEHPHLEINLLDRRERKIGQRPMYAHQYFDNLVYIYSYHQRAEWEKDANGDWVMIKKGQPLPDDDGYAIDLHSFQAGHPVIAQEQMDIVFEIRKFLVERILPLKQKKLLTKVA